MYSNKSALAVAAALVVGLGSAGTASANVYAGSGLNLDNLTIAVTPNDEHVEINNFNFTTTNTATLNGSSVIESKNCGGNPSASGSNTCNGGTPRLDALPANAPGGTVSRSNNSFTFFGPGTADEFANSDSVIQTAELAGDDATATNQIAETQLQTGSSASANAEIQSTTGFTFDFTLADNGTLVLSFDADPDLFAQIEEATDGAFNTQANVNTSFTLSQNTGGDGNVNWNPQGTANNDCSAGGSAGLTCAEDNDSQDLNTNVGTTSNHTNDQYSWDPNADNLTPFGITIAGLTAGDWTLTLNSVTSTSITRNVGVPPAVPEPGTLLLLGAGLAAGGFVSRRKKRA